MLTMKEHLETLSEPYRSAALMAIADRPRAAQMKCKSAWEALAWALPAGELKRNPFWAHVFDPAAPARPERRYLHGATYVKAYHQWQPEPGEQIEASTDGSLWAKRTFISNNPTETGGKYVVMTAGAVLQFCQLIRPLRPSPFNRRA